MENGKITTRKLVAAALTAYFTAVGLFFVSGKMYPARVEESGVRIVPPVEVARALSLGHPGFVADMLLAGITVHSGSLMWKPLRIPFDSAWAYGTVDLITDLDPRFFKAYLYSAMGMIHDFDDVHRARPIVEKGMAVFPDSWELPFWIGYDYYAYFHDYDTAAPYLWEAYNKPDAPKSFLSLMLSTLRHSGDYEKALVIIRNMYEDTGDESLKMVYAKHMIQLDNLLLLQKTARTYRDVRGHLPDNIGIMVQEGLLPELPEDPFGMSYEIDHESDALVVLGKRRK